MTLEPGVAMATFVAGPREAAIGRRGGDDTLSSSEAGKAPVLCRSEHESPEGRAGSRTKQRNAPWSQRHLAGSGNVEPPGGEVRIPWGAEGRGGGDPAGTWPPDPPDQWGGGIPTPSPPPRTQP